MKYYTIETNVVERRRVWRVVKVNRKNDLYGFHRGLRLVFKTREECEGEIEKRKLRTLKYCVDNVGDVWPLKRKWE